MTGAGTQWRERRSLTRCFWAPDDGARGGRRECKRFTRWRGGRGGGRNAERRAAQSAHNDTGGRERKSRGFTRWRSAEEVGRFTQAAENETVRRAGARPAGENAGACCCATLRSDRTQSAVAPPPSGVPCASLAVGTDPHALRSGAHLVHRPAKVGGVVHADVNAVCAAVAAILRRTPSGLTSASMPDGVKPVPCTVAGRGCAAGRTRRCTPGVPHVGIAARHQWKKSVSYGPMALFRSGLPVRSISAQPSLGMVLPGDEKS